MAYPNMTQSVEYLGWRMRDKITGVEGVVASVSFDLYGCVQVVINPGLDKDGKLSEQHWFDIQRLEHVENTARVMDPPSFDDALTPSNFRQGPAEKPAFQRA